MPDAQGNERFCFSLPAEFLVCVNTKTEAEAWLMLRTWLNQHRLYDLHLQETDPAKQRTPREDLASLPAVLESAPQLDNGIQEKRVFLTVQCHEIHLAGRSVPG